MKFIKIYNIITIIQQVNLKFKIMLNITQTIDFLKKRNISVNESECLDNGEKLTLRVLNDVPFSVLDDLTDHYCRVTLGDGVLILTNIKD